LKFVRFSPASHHSTIVPYSSLTTSGNCLRLYSGDARFEFRPEHRLLDLDFSWFSSARPGKFLKSTSISYDRFLPNPFQFISHPIIRRYIIWTLTVFLNNQLIRRLLQMCDSPDQAAHYHTRYLPRYGVRKLSWNPAPWNYTVTKHISNICRL
jgi:hypothetical protein